MGDRSIRDSLPLPVARLWRRARNAKSAKDRHDTAYFAWEVSIRLCVAAAPPADPTPLARASIGTWASALPKGDRPIQEASLLDAHRAWAEVVTGTAPARRSIPAKELFATLAAYRNKVIGHGSVREADFYDANGKGLLEALEVAWRSGLFLADGARLVFVESVELTSTGERKARVLEVSGDASMVIDPNGIYVPDQILPRRLYLRTASAWTPLHPWLLFDETEEHLWCFNGLGRRAEYLDYASGETLGGDGLETAFAGVEDEVRALLGPGDRSADSRGAEIAEDRRFGDYEVLGKLGQGGMGAVYLARQQSLGRLVALKMLPAERAKDAVAVARFRREIRALAKCDHPNVVKIFASGETRGIHYYAMEYVDGVDLGRVAKSISSADDFDSAVSSECEAARAERLNMFPDLPWIPRKSSSQSNGEDRFRQMARFFVQVAEGLHNLHEHGIVHRDISPANIMVTWPDQRAVIMDLGLAALQDASFSVTTDKSAILGTLKYMAPEMLQKAYAELDRRADVYALGATMYEVVSGRPPFDGDTEPRLIHQVLREDPPPLDGASHGAPPLLALIILRACTKEPERRHPTAAILALDLTLWIAGKPILSHAPSRLERALYAVKREPQKYLFAASLLGTLGIAGLLLVTVPSLRAILFQPRVDFSDIELWSGKSAQMIAMLLEMPPHATSDDWAMWRESAEALLAWSASRHGEEGLLQDTADVLALDPAQVALPPSDSIGRCREHLGFGDQPISRLFTPSSRLDQAKASNANNSQAPAQRSSLAVRENSGEPRRTSLPGYPSGKWSGVTSERMNGMQRQISDTQALQLQGRSSLGLATWDSGLGSLASLTESDLATVAANSSAAIARMLEGGEDLDCNNERARSSHELSEPTFTGINKAYDDSFALFSGLDELVPVCCAILTTPDLGSNIDAPLIRSRAARILYLSGYRIPTGLQPTTDTQEDIDRAIFYQSGLTHMASALTVFLSARLSQQRMSVQAMLKHYVESRSTNQRPSDDQISNAASHLARITLAVQLSRRTREMASMNAVMSIR
ncbi:MAG: serine/threonine-protein kinase [Planctomycetota bacterium]|nr:serine/threonine-protein kinase [Planctomycetota bacterium]